MSRMSVDLTIPQKNEVDVQIIGDLDGIQFNIEVEGMCWYRINLKPNADGDMVLSAVDHQTGEPVQASLELKGSIVLQTGGAS